MSCPAAPTLACPASPGSGRVRLRQRQWRAALTLKRPLPETAAVRMQRGAISASYMACLRPRFVDERSEDRVGRSGVDADGAAPWGGNGDSAPTTLGRSRHATGSLGGAQHAIGVPPQGRTAAEALRSTARSESVPAPHGLHARPELDDDLAGIYMQDAIDRGGYRAALEYYDSEDAKKSEDPWDRLTAKGWLLGRLGLYDRVDAWLGEIATWPDFGHISAAGISAQCPPYRTPSLWLETPRPSGRNAGFNLTIKSVAAAGPSTGCVPDYIWTVMLILDAAGPICSHAGLGAAVSLVATDPSRMARGGARGDRMRDPLRGARLHGAPECCHRWIIADIDFDPRPVNKPHYYYDLTDEGRRTLDKARAAGAPWPKSMEAAATGLRGASLSDLLEGACGLGGPLSDLDKMRGELGCLVNAWRDRANGVRTTQVGTEDQALADLGPPTKWHDTDDGLGSTFDHLLYLMTVIESVHAIACEAEPGTYAEGAVLRTLVGTLQDLCRRHGTAVAEAASAKMGATDTPAGDATGGHEAVQRYPPYADVTPALISDAYYCLSEYCGSRRLALDPCSLPLPEQLTAEEKDAMAKALKSSLDHSDTG